MNLSVGSHEQRVGCPPEIQRNPDGIAQLVIEEAGDEELSREFRDAVINLSLQDGFDAALRKIVNPEGFAEEAVAALAVGQQHFVTESSGTG
ncbi:hypothetical protein D3C71_1405270 [compost metagenome]